MSEPAGAFDATGNPISRAFMALVAGLNSVGTAWIFALMVLINVDVLARYFFNAPIQGVAEVVELSIVGIVFVVQVWPIRLILVLGCIGVALQFLVLAWQNVKALQAHSSSSAGSDP